MKWLREAEVPAEKIDTLMSVTTALYNACVSALNELKETAQAGPEHKAITIQDLQDAISKAEEVFHQ